MSAPSRIRRLPDALVNKIAAGEVVERPASAVKELVENALDAGARTIAVDLRDGGGASIRVADDGVGMTAAELSLALERHATSKLPRDEDLDAIATLGFRGEALPAICAVSRFTLTSRARGAAEGVRVGGEGGAVTQRLAVPAEQGTVVEIRDLFFNTPARLKFLKSPATELATSVRTLTALAIAHPHVALRVTHNGRPVVTAPASRGGAPGAPAEWTLEDLRARLGALWGWETARRLLPVDRSEHGVDVQGFASPPDLTRGGRDDIVVIVNGRPVRDPALLQGVLEAYRPLLPRDRFPLVALALRVPTPDVDVNVHPTKAWVRFRHPRLVQEMVVTAVRGALRRPAVAPELAPPPAAASSPAATAEIAAQQEALFAEAPAPYGPPLFGRVLGQVQNTFVVATSEQEVFFVDQHVAHERVLFERLQADVDGGAVASQALLFPEPLDVDPAARALLERWRGALERLGFAFEADGDALVISAVPTLLKGEDPARLVEAAVEELGTAKAGAPAVERALAFVACRAAVKADTPLAREEMERLVADLASTATPYFCPHGRPVVSRISVADIRRELKRTW
jgi:DNA mismatch repair protein MutL